jgi:exodeoxyribonuclease V alpha subunit
MANKTPMQTFPELEAALANRELFTSIDTHFANFMARLAKKYPQHVALAAALVSHKTGAGNICLDLEEYAAKPLDANSTEMQQEQGSCPSLPEWSECLLESSVVARGEGNTPLVLDRQGRLYLRRYWEYENSIIHFILERCSLVMEGLNFARLARDLEDLFPSSLSGQTDWQKIAALAAVSRSFCVISGGPGTGKTSTVAKILALLLSQSENPGKMRLLLGAPTGKAASRLQDALVSTGLLQGMPEPPKAATIHRILGFLPNSPYFRHNAKNHLAADVIIIDEASMVDLPLMAKLMQAVPASARLILLGDRHQLASVQPGSVLGDICHSASMKSFSDSFCRFITEHTGDSLAPVSKYDAGKENDLLQDSFVELVQSYRFSPESSIARLAAAVKEGDADTALDLLLSGKNNGITWSELPSPDQIAPRLLSWPGFEHYALLQHSLDPDACFDVLDRFRLLCSLRSGPYGMEKINSILSQQIVQQSMVKVSRSHPAVSKPLMPFQPGQPLMVTRNDYSLQLFNGDVGVVLPDPHRHDMLRVFFRKDSGSIHDIPPAMLPAHETVFAMTVHKSQGSEFDTVLLILPDRDFPVLTRELLYTAITRARHKVEIWGKKEIFRSAVQRRIKRTSGLSEALWGTAGNDL